MRLAKVQIDNFRSFENETIIIDDYTCFVGANGAGKSTILTALNVFFRNNSSTSTDVCKLSEEDFHHKNTTKPIKITLTFEDLTEEEKEDFRHYYRQNKLILFAQAIWDQNRQCAEVIQHGSRMVMHEFKDYFEADQAGQRAEMLRDIYAGIRQKFNDLPNVTVKGQMYQSLREYEEKNPEFCKPLDEPNQLYGWTKGENKLKKSIEWIYVPAVKDAASEQDESKQTAVGHSLP